jgi:ATP-dependent protease ClpP protease subunit
VKLRGVQMKYELPTVNGKPMGRFRGLRRPVAEDAGAAVTVLRWDIQRSGAAAVITVESERTHINRLPLVRTMLNDALHLEPGTYRKRLEAALRRLRAEGVTRLDVVIDSEGGARASGQGIAEALRGWHGRKRLLIDGACSSAATLILCLPRWDCTTITARSHITIHNPTTKRWIVGTETGRIRRQETQRRKETDREFLRLYHKRTGRRKELLRAWMAEGKTFTAMEAVVAGFVEEMRPRSAWEQETEEGR